MIDSGFLSSVRTIAIVGASGAIGSEFLNFFLANDSVKKIYAFSRKALQETNEKISYQHLDYKDEQSIISASKIIDTDLDLILITTGVLHDSQHMPEKSLKDYTSDSAEFYFLNNTIGPSLVIKHLWPLLAKKRQTVIATLCARIGSIEDNRLGGWYSYRASKAALAMMVKSASIEISRRNPDAISVTLHPGTVHSPLSEPFHKHIDPNTIITPKESVEKLTTVINQLKPEDNGLQFAYDGSRVPF